MNNTAIHKAVEIAGSQSALAKRIGTRQGDVWKWLKGRKVKPDLVLAIEEATGVSKHDLRPDIFGPAPQRPAQPATGQEVAA